VNGPDHDPIGELLAKLARRDGRAEAASATAERIGAAALLILIRDPETGALHPAPGFRQTLPGGATWGAVLARCAEPGEFRARVAYPDLRSFEDADVWVGAQGAAILLIGGTPRMRAGEIAAASPLLLALLASEAEADAARARAHVAGAASERANMLARSLEEARARLADSARALREALAEAAHLNRELKALNETLEQRVNDEMAERAKVEDELRQAQKMEAIGQLTGGVAHDFNNLLTVIIGGLDNVARQVAAGLEDASLPRVQRGVEMAQKAAQRAATLTSRLLAFSRRQALDPRPLHPDRLVRDMSELLRRSLGETVRLELVGAGGLWAAFADPNELEHAILNLAVNARDAMPQGGTLTIETGNVWLDEAYLASVAEPVPPGQYVMIAVSDTGMGMDSETLSRVFEPFFTTKEPGRGTGLGLSQVYGFVRQSGGHIRVYSELGQGTTVKLYLPRVSGEVAPEVAKDVTPDATMLRGTETVLLVEDDEAVRAYSGGVLRDLGYRVVEAEDAATALSALDQNPVVDLLFTDVVLPGGVHGRRLADEARRRRPALRVLFTSGYTRNAIIHNGRLDPGVQLITKPFSYGELASRIRRVLDGHAETAPLRNAPDTGPEQSGALSASTTE
jgi:signal transduction histidine kinase/ActR/RegA family two-component response regulator